MRTRRQAFEPLLPAMWTWYEVAFRTRHEVNDQRDHPGKRNPTQDRYQLSILRVATPGVLHDPNRRENPGPDTYRDHEHVNHATSQADPGRSSNRGGIFGTRRIAGAG